jgi:N-acetylmuramoyl-L-alanine amidase
VVKKHVLVAVGHGRRPNGVIDPGACLRASVCEQPEGDPIVSTITNQLRAHNVEVTVVPAGGPNYVGTTELANQLGVDFILEIHHDWSGAPRGMFGFWFPGSVKGQRMANAIRDELLKALNYPHRANWHRANDTLYILRRTRMPAVLWECDRIGSVADKVKYGRAVANGVLNGLGIGIAPPPKPVPTPGINITYQRLVKPITMRTNKVPT